jgi:SAM-dependent methyltransferase
VPVEVDVAPQLLDALFKRVETQWENLGRSEPYWSVLADSKFRRDRIESNEADFYASGAADRDLFAAAAQRCGVELPVQGTCFELGCGVGRVTPWLAQYFRRVIAADISTFHLDMAQQALARQAIENVELRRLDAPRVLAALPRFEGFFCYIVLQHNPPPVMQWLLRTSLEKLRPGGLGFFQLPTVGSGYTFDAADYLRKPSDELIEMHVLPQTTVLAVLEEMACVLLEVREHDCIGNPDWVSKTFLVRKRSSRERNGLYSEQK